MLYQLGYVNNFHDFLMFSPFVFIVLPIIGIILSLDQALNHSTDDQTTSRYQYSEPGINEQPMQNSMPIQTPVQPVLIGTVRGIDAARRLAEDLRRNS